MLIATIGASLSMDRNANNWTALLAAGLRVGKQSAVQVANFGMQGTASNYWISAGWVERAAVIRPDICLIDSTCDANTSQNISLAQALANLYAMVDAVQAKNAAVKIFLLTMNHMLPAATQFTSVTSYYAQLPTVKANRSNVDIIDCYTAWGDPSLHPSEYGSDPIHPLLAGNLRVTIPIISAALAGLIS